MSEMERHKLIWSMYDGAMREAQHFNVLQSGYRKLGAGWLLAVFSATGFLLFPEGNEIHSKSAYYYLAILGLVSSAGVIALWVIDMLAYHHLLMASFSAGKKLEDDNQWLPPIRRNMDKLTRFWTITNKVYLFYMVGATTCLTLSAASTFVIMCPDQFPNTLNSKIFMIVAILSFIIIGLFLYLGGRILVGNIESSYEDIEVRPISLHKIPPATLSKYSEI